MTFALRSLVVAVLLLFLGAAPATAQSSAAVAGFAQACNSNPDFFDFKVKDIASDPMRLGALCTCLTTGVAQYTDADIVMMTKDLDGSATTADRVAYGDYTALEARALATLNSCVVQTAAPGVDMAAFDAACANGEIMLEVVEGSETNRTALCDCLSASLEPRVSAADVTVLAADLDGTSTEEMHTQHGNYDALAELAGGVLDQCFAELPVPTTP